MTEYHGHATLADGSHVPLTAEDASALQNTIMKAKQARIDAMPTEADALRQFFEAVKRLEDLGWRNPMYLCDAGECDMIELGSTGVHRGAYSGKWPHGNWWYRDEMDTARPYLVRALAKLTGEG